jgi:hypothetical protein
MNKKLIMALIVAVIAVVAGITVFYLWGGGLIPPKEPTYSELTISKAPTLGETAELTFKVWLREDYPHENRESMILISLPEGITWAENAFVTIDNEIKTLRIVPSSELIFSDNYTHFGVENVWITKKPLEVKGTVRAIKNGKWNIVADALTLTHQSSYATKFLGLFVSENEAYAQEGGFWSGVP